MNRRNIITWITGALGIGTAQRLSTLTPEQMAEEARWKGKCVGMGYKPVDCFPIGWQNGKAKNGQCPVCGTMAKPIGRIGGPYLENGWNTWQARCAHCNAAFYQDAE